MVETIAGLKALPAKVKIAPGIGRKQIISPSVAFESVNILLPMELLPLAHTAHLQSIDKRGVNTLHLRWTMSIRTHKVHLFL